MRGTYDDLGQRGFTPGGEFLAAIKVILYDKKIYSINI